MIGDLPKSLNVGGIDYDIRTDYRVALTIFQAYGDPELTRVEQMAVCLQSLFEVVPGDITEALEKASWFLDGGDKVKLKELPVKTLDWEQDEGLIFPEVNKVAGYETRDPEQYLHWWTFLGYFSTIGDGMFAQILNIRQKRARGKSLEKWEKELFNTHKEMIIIHEKLTAEEQAELDEEQAFIDSLL